MSDSRSGQDSFTLKNRISDNILPIYFSLDLLFFFFGIRPPLCCSLIHKKQSQDIWSHKRTLSKTCQLFTLAIWRSYIKVFLHVLYKRFNKTDHYLELCLACEKLINNFTYRKWCVGFIWFTIGFTVWINEISYIYIYISGSKLVYNFITLFCRVVNLFVPTHKLWVRMAQLIYIDFQKYIYHAQQ